MIIHVIATTYQTALNSSEVHIMPTCNLIRSRIVRRKRWTNVRILGQQISSNCVTFGDMLHPRYVFLLNRQAWHQPKRTSGKIFGRFQASHRNRRDDFYLILGEFLFVENDTTACTVVADGHVKEYMF